MNALQMEIEQLDPTLGVFDLFPFFDDKFFAGKLSCVKLEWSKRMFKDAGVCIEAQIPGKPITIRLSEPLLKLRPRTDQIDVLLHEMIHAYCFIEDIPGSHGPAFKKIMNFINRLAGTNITVHHNFHSEMKRFETHWWKCTGPCKNYPPHYGMRKRCMNRAPNRNEPWFIKHEEYCGGKFIKVSEPEPKKKQKKKENNLPSHNVINTSEQNPQIQPRPFPAPLGDLSLEEYWEMCGPILQFDFLLD